jgi:hypothetical protein
LGVGPDACEAVDQPPLARAALGVEEVFKEEAMGEVVGEGGVGFSEAGEVGVGFDGIADIDDEEEGGIVVGDGADVGFGLSFGADEGVVPELGAANAVAFFEFGSGGGADVGFGLFVLFFNALLCFEDEVGFVVEVDKVGRGFSIGVGDGDSAVEDIDVFRIVGCGGMGLGELRASQSLTRKCW